jgi:DNA polymerase lambda
MEIERDVAVKYLEILATDAIGFRKTAFLNAIKQIRTQTNEKIPISTIGGKGIQQRLREVVQTGHLKEVDEKMNKLEILGMFAQVMGVGPVTAEKWYNKGYRTLTDVKNEPHLTKTQKLGLEYFDDLQKKIPRSEIDYYNDVFTTIVRKCNEKLEKYDLEIVFEIAGSYRRKKVVSGDIDCIFYVKGDQSQKIKVFDMFLDLLKNMKLITHIIAKGDVKVMGLIRMHAHSPQRRIDFEITEPENYAFALFYFTGSVNFNVKMRGKAKSMGYHLDQKSLHLIGDSKKTIALRSEREIMDFLDEEYLTPEERV